MKNRKFKVGDKIKYMSFGKPASATIEKIIPGDERPLKIRPKGYGRTLTSIKIKNVLQ